MARVERQQLADRLSALPDDAWAQPTLCAGWAVRDIVGHMIAIGTMSAGRFFSGMAKNGFSFDKFQSQGIKSNTEGKAPAQILAAFTATVDSHHKPPGPATTVLGEVLVHGEDIFRPQDRRYLVHPADHVVTVAEFYKRNGFPLKVKQRIAGVTLRMTDADWSYGSGPEASGPGISILMAMVGRKIALGELQGEGVSILNGRS
ncbi:MAG: maleylpyruvate isomerase family mycothiol-dependent enzyme [Acidimicrobiales bacterium]|jgi:uncharacterized protein (TIGR03083 family)